MTNRRLQRKLEQESRLAGDHAGEERSRFSPGRSGLVTASLLALALLGFGFLWRAHQRAEFHQLTTPKITQTSLTPGPGGQEAAVLGRSASTGGKSPEFVGATILPGLGMQVLQLAVQVPGRPAQNLFAAPTVEEIADSASLKPDAAPFHLTLSSQGEFGGNTSDLVAETGATGMTNRADAEGGEVTGTITVLDATGQPTGVDAKVDNTMTGKSFEVAVRLRNGALSSRDYSLNWSPRFAAPDGDLTSFLLSIPATDRLSGSGKLPLDGSPLDFSSPAGKPVPDTDFDQTYTGLHREGVGEGSVVRLVDRKGGFALNIILLSPSIRSVHTHVDGSAHTLTLSFGTDEDTQRTALQAGESAEFHLRMDVLPLSKE